MVCAGAGKLIVQTSSQLEMARAGHLHCGDQHVLTSLPQPEELLAKHLLACPMK